MKPLQAYTVIALAVAIGAFGCSSSKEAPKKTAISPGGDFNIVNLREINSEDNDFAPFVLPNGNYLLFTSNRQTPEYTEKIDNKSLYGETIYKAEGADPYWHTPSLYSPALKKAPNAGEYVLAPGAEKVFFSSAYMEPNVGGSDIYFMERTVGQWSTPMSVFAVNTKWWEAHPAVSPDGNMIVFATNRQTTEPDVSVKGYFQTDLWYSIRDENGNWNRPSRFPEPLNSEFSEISPFYTPDGYLYFATNRYEGQGFDIVRTRKMGLEWTEPERLPAPVNSTSDDVFPFIYGDNQAIYFASDRSGGEGGLDIYRSDFPMRVQLRGVISVEGQGKEFATPSGVAVRIVNTVNDSSFIVFTNEAGEYHAVLRPGATYTVVASSEECYNRVPAKEVDASMTSAFDTTFVRDFSVSRIVFPHFKLERYNIPFFVTGYYYPNTNANLDNLDRRIASGELGPFEGGTTPYIDLKDEDYRSYANRIETIFDTIYTSITEKYLNMFNHCALKEENLLIEVRGFVDPRGLVPGIYADKNVSTKTMTIRKGEAMAGQSGNDKLANLRAYYTMEMIDRELAARSPLYRQLKADGRIILTAYGVGIDTETGGEKMQDPAKRRIDIQFEIVDKD